MVLGILANIIVKLVFKTGIQIKSSLQKMAENATVLHRTAYKNTALRYGKVYMYMTFPKEI